METSTGEWREGWSYQFCTVLDTHSAPLYSGPSTNQGLWKVLTGHSSLRNPVSDSPSTLSQPAPQTHSPSASACSPPPPPHSQELIQAEILACSQQLLQGLNYFKEPRLVGCFFM